MAYALTALQRVAAVIETTAGTAMTAQRIVPHLTGSSFTENEERQKLEEARGVLAFTDDVLTRRSSQLELQQELDWDMCLPTFLCGVEAVNATGGPPYVYRFAPGLTAAKDKSTATWEVVQSDGATDYISRRFGNARPTAIALEFQDGSTTQLTSTWMGQAAETVTKATLNPGLLVSRRVTPTDLWAVYIDNSWAQLGTTAAQNVRAISWSYTPGIEPSYHLVGRPNLDMDGWYDGRIEATLTLTLDLNAAAAAEIARWRAGDMRYVRLQADNGVSGDNKRSITIDQAVRIITSPDLLASDGEQATVELAMELRAPDAVNPFLEIEIQSGLAAWNLTAPGTPTGLKVAAPPDGTTLRATWAAASSGGGVRDYSLRWDEKGATDWNQIDAIPIADYLITGLTANTEYDVQVRANNIIGSSGWTTTVTERTDST